MKPTDDIGKVIRRLNVRASAGLDQRVLTAIGQAAASPAAPAPLEQPSIWTLITLIMKTKSTQCGLAATIGVAVVGAVILHVASTPAWAIEQAIEALQKYRAVHITGHQNLAGKSTPAEVWARADSTGLRSEECMVISEGAVAWVKDNRTYSYDTANNKVFVDPAITVGVNPWFGPKLLATLSKARDCRTVEGTDPATGQKRVLLTCSMESAVGPQSFLIEFDAKTKLPVSIKVWPERERRGSPLFSWDSILYFEDLPDSAFVPHVPAGAQFVDKPLEVPEANLPLLTDPKCGISTQGLSREEACRKILGQLWAAAIKDDLAAIRQLCPITAQASDELLRDIARQDEPVEVLSIGGIEKEGRSKLGPIALAPSRVRCKDGKTREVKMIVQFRQNGQDASCVVHGPYGFSVEVK